MLLDLEITHQKGLVGDVESGTALAAAIMTDQELRILLEGNRIINKITVLDFGRTDFGLLKNLFGRSLVLRDLEVRRT